MPIMCSSLVANKISPESSPNYVFGYHFLKEFFYAWSCIKLPSLSYYIFLKLCSTVWGLSILNKERLLMVQKLKWKVEEDEEKETGSEVMILRMQFRNFQTQHLWGIRMEITFDWGHIMSLQDSILKKSGQKFRVETIFQVESLYLIQFCTNPVRNLTKWCQRMPSGIPFGIILVLKLRGF